MPYTPRILAFSGSLRRGSLNKKLVAVAAEGARQAGAEVTLLDLRELNLPVYDQDLEESDGLPDGAVKLKQLMADHQGLLIAAPEYNSSITAALKNTIDWASRQGSPDEPMLASFSGKVAALISASPGALGGLRGLVHVRSILSNIQVMVLPDQKAIPRAFEAFDDAGQLKDPAQQAAIEAIGAKLTRVLAALEGSHA